MFLFLAALAAGLFAFLTIATWVAGPAKERLARDRFALLKTLAEQPGENASRVLEMLRKEDEERIARRQREERRGWIDGGLVLMAVGLGLGVMMTTLIGPGEWSVGLIPFLLGCALFGIGLSRSGGRKSNVETR
jgi:hypothetical protein